MKEFFVKAKQLIQELILLRHNQSDWFIKLERKKDSTATQFKIKNYMKWVVLLDTQINNNSKINTISDIKTLKFTEKLEAKLCELFDNGDIKDIFFKNKVAGNNGRVVIVATVPIQDVLDRLRL